VSSRNTLIAYTFLFYRKTYWYIGLRNFFSRSFSRQENSLRFLFLSKCKLSLLLPTSKKFCFQSKVPLKPSWLQRGPRFWKGSTIGIIPPSCPLFASLVSGWSKPGFNVLLSWRALPAIRSLTSFVVLVCRIGSTQYEHQIYARKALLLLPESWLHQWHS